MGDILTMLYTVAIGYLEFKLTWSFCILTGNPAKCISNQDFVEQAVMVDPRGSQHLARTLSPPRGVCVPFWQILFQLAEAGTGALHISFSPLYYVVL